jgi:hypothetical protein
VCSFIVTEKRAYITYTMTVTAACLLLVICFSASVNTAVIRQQLHPPSPMSPSSQSAPQTPYHGRRRPAADSEGTGSTLPSNVPAAAAASSSSIEQLEQRAAHEKWLLEQTKLRILTGLGRASGGHGGIPEAAGGGGDGQQSTKESGNVDVSDLTRTEYLVLRKPQAERLGPSGGSRSEVKLSKPAVGRSKADVGYDLPSAAGPVAIVLNAETGIFSLYDD